MKPIHSFRGSNMDLSDTYSALLQAKLLPIDRQGGVLLNLVEHIDQSAKTNRSFRFLFNEADKAVLRWFDKAVAIEDTDYALFDDDMVNMSRYILTSRIADKADDCEICEATVWCARTNVNMADCFGVNMWWCR